jgi:hypothetical protein
MSTYDPERPDEAWHLLRKVFLLLLVVTASALGLVLLSRRSSNVPLILFNILADASLGVLVGLATRMVLRGRNSLIQGLVSAAISLIGLAILGYLTAWKSGIGPLSMGWVSVHVPAPLNSALLLPLQFKSSTMNLLDLAHIVIAVDGSWLALRVWRQGTRVTRQGSLPARRVKRPARPQQSRPAPPPPMPSAPRVPSTPANSNGGARISRQKIGRPSITRAAPAPLRPMRSKSRRGGSILRRSRPAVQLAVFEEHRCPFCLEPVNRNDPRGTVECQICHTLHHKDCWDITGNCQVPHLNG